MSLSVIAFVAASLLSQALGLGPVVLVLLGWLAVLGLAAASGERLALLPKLLSFAAMFTMVALAESFLWSPGYDPKDFAATLLFFFVIPSAVLSMTIGRSGILRQLAVGLVGAFWLLSVCVLTYGLFAGIDLQRDVLFVPGLQKNGLAGAYEVLFLFTFASAARPLTRLISLVTALTALAIIGSKTAFALSLLFALGLWSRRVFVVAAPVVLVAVIWQALQFDPTSSLRTAGFRLLTWAQVWEEISGSTSALLFGNGPGTFVSKIQLFGMEGLHGAHNMILQFWHGYGLVMVVLILCFLLWLWRRFGFFSSPGMTAFWLFNFHALFDVGWVKGPGFVASLVFGVGLAESIRVIAPRMAEARLPMSAPDLGPEAPVPSPGHARS